MLSVRTGEGKIIEMAKAEGKTPEAFISEKYAERKSVFGVAWALGVYPNAVRYWLKKAKRTRR